MNLAPPIILNIGLLNVPCTMHHDSNFETITNLMHKYPYSYNIILYMFRVLLCCFLFLDLQNEVGLSIILNIGLLNVPCTVHHDRNFEAITNIMHKYLNSYNITILYISVSQTFFKWGPLSLVRMFYGPLSLVRMFYGPPYSWHYQTH